MKAERQLYMALMGYLFYFYADQPQYQTFPQMLDLLQLAGKDNPSQTKTPLDIIMLGTTAEDGFQGFEEWIVANHGGDEAAAQASEEYFVIKQYKGFKSTSGSPETEASVIASCNVRLAPFAVSAVREFFSEDELELEAIGQEPTAFFLSCPTPTRRSTSSWRCCSTSCSTSTRPSPTRTPARTARFP